MESAWAACRCRAPSFGTDMCGIFGLIGTSYKLVTVDGRKADCANPLGL